MVKRGAERKKGKEKERMWAGTAWKKEGKNIYIWVISMWFSAFQREIQRFIIVFVGMNNLITFPHS